jgi:hypothetical protein
MTCNVKQRESASHRNLGIAERTDSDAAVLAWSLTGLVASKKQGPSVKAEGAKQQQARGA